MLDLEAEPVDGNDVVELLGHVDKANVGMLAGHDLSCTPFAGGGHVCRRFQASASVSPRIETIWSNSACPAINGGEI